MRQPALVVLPRALRGALVAALMGGAVVATTSSSATAAAPREGSPDTSFAGTGLRDLAVAAGATSEYAADAALLSDGSIVAVGAAETAEGLSALVRRVTPAGAADLSFGTGGAARFRPSGIDGELSDVAVTATDRIVVAGRGTAPGGDWFIVARFLPSGGLDTSFSGDGWDVISEGTGENVSDVVVDAQGRVTVLGRVQPVGDTAPRTWIGRWTAAGAPDTTFDGDGKLVLTAMPWGRGLLLDGAGRTVVVGSGGSGTTEDARIVRLTTSGAPDADFYGTGTLSLPITGERDYLTDVQHTPDGGIVAAGSATSAGVRRVVTVRFDVSGQLRSGYGVNGISLASGWTGDGLVTGLAVQRDGRPVLAVQSDDLLTALRLAPSGSPASDQPDPAFGSTAVGRVGSATVPVPGSTGAVPAYAEAAMVDARGRIVLVGSAAPPGGGSRIVLTRLAGDLTPPAAASIAALASVTTAPTVTLRLGGGADAGTGLAGYDVYVRSAVATSSAFPSWTLLRSATTATSVPVTLSPGRTWCFLVRARDRAGNLGPAGPERCTAAPVDDRSLVRRGTWASPTSTAYYRGTATRSSASGATLTYAGADYRRLSLVARTCPTCGSVAVYRGTTLLKVVSLRSARTVDRAVLPVQSSSGVLSGTLRVRQVSAGKPVVVDGLAVSLR